MTSQIKFTKFLSHLLDYYQLRLQLYWDKDKGSTNFKSFEKLIVVCRIFESRTNVWILICTEICYMRQL